MSSKLIGTSQEAFVEFRFQDYTICEEIDLGGGGSGGSGGGGSGGGGGTPTDPTYPPGYDPCKDGPIEVSSKGNNVSVEAPTPCDRKEPGGPTPIGPPPPVLHPADPYYAFSFINLMKIQEEPFQGLQVW